MTRTVLLLALLLQVVGCTGDGPSAESSSRSALVAPSHLPERWTATDDLDGPIATEVGAGFCRLEEMLADAQPSAEVSAVLVRRQALLRHSVLTLDEGEGERLLRRLDRLLRACSGQRRSLELGLDVSPVPADGPASGHRMTIEVAGVPWVVDLRLWHDDDRLSLARLSYPRRAVEDPGGVLDAVPGQPGAGS